MNVDERPPSKKCRRTEGRVRVTRACDLCKKKKLRCTGSQPCSLCMQGKQDCTYLSEYNRGKVPSISIHPSSRRYSNRTTNSSQHEGPASPGTTSRPHESTLLSMTEATSLGGHGSRASQDREGQPGRNLHADAARILTMPETQVDPSVRDAGRSSRNSPEPAHTDQEGHYVGPASGVSFLSRALKKLHQGNHHSPTKKQCSIFSFADASLPQYDPYFLILPSKLEAQALLGRYFDVASPTHRYLHQPTMERWCEEFYNSINKPQPLAPGAHEIRAIMLTVLAQAKEYSPRDDSNLYDSVNSTAFFAAAEHHLSLETGGIRLTGIQARLVQCYFLLSQSRVNTAWSLFGTVVNLVLTIGLHRRRMRDAIAGVDFIEQECRKRVFWSVYTLDSYLSAALGRPRSFHEEDVDQELPLCLDDCQITPMKILTSQHSGQSLMRASIYHAKLSKIISGILRDLYGIRRLSPKKQLEVMQMYDGRLLQWREEIGDFLDITNTEVMMIIYRRQHAVLHLAYSHAVVLLYRQALLMRSSASTIRHDSKTQTALHHSVRRCLEAATAIVTKLRQLVEKQQMYSAFWFTHYYVFSALVALYLYVVQNRPKAAQIWHPYLEVAQQGLRDLQACAADTSYAQRYVVVLTELQNEAMKPAEDENQPAGFANGVRSSYGQPTTVFEHASNVDAGAQLVPPVAGHGAVSAGELPPIADELGFPVSQESSLPLQHDIFNCSGDVLSLQDLDNVEAFGNLGMEGLADLEFMFPTEETSAFHAEVSTI